MNLKQIQSLSDEDLGKELAWRIGWFVCIGKYGLEYGKERDKDLQPIGEYLATRTLCTSLDHISEAEKLVIEKVGLADYGRCLVGVTGHHGIGLDSIAQIATASARDRAEACLLALES